MTNRDDLIGAAVQGVPEEWVDPLAFAMAMTDPWSRWLVIHDEGDVWGWRWFETSQGALLYAIDDLCKRGVTWRPFNVWQMLGGAISDAVIHEVPDWDVAFP